MNGQMLHRLHSHWLTTSCTAFCRCNNGMPSNFEETITASSLAPQLSLSPDISQCAIGLSLEVSNAHLIEATMSDVEGIDMTERSDHKHQRDSIRSQSKQRRIFYWHCFRFCRSFSSITGALVVGSIFSAVGIACASAGRWHAQVWPLWIRVVTMHATAVTLKHCENVTIPGGITNSAEFWKNHGICASDVDASWWPVTNDSADCTIAIATRCWHARWPLVRRRQRWRFRTTR